MYSGCVCVIHFVCTVLITSVDRQMMSTGNCFCLFWRFRLSFNSLACSRCEAEEQWVGSRINASSDSVASLFSLPRCFFICPIALWLEKIDADTLTLAWRNSVAFSRAERSAVFYHSGVDCIFPCGPKHVFFYPCTTCCIQAFLSPALEKQLCL